MARPVICATLPASACDLFAGLYQATGYGLETIWEDALITPDDLAARLAEYDSGILTGVLGPHRESLLARLGEPAWEVRLNPTPAARTVARLGAPLLVGGGEPVHALAPRYVRPSAAEARRVAATGAAAP